jgi:mannitol-specific phosphotransferase system IIBC component
MLATLLTLAAETAETAEEEPSKTPFYILGALAAVWAIVLFAVGMRSPAFPGSVAAQRAVMAVSVLVVIGAMASAVITA